MKVYVITLFSEMADNIYRETIDVCGSEEKVREVIETKISDILANDTLGRDAEVVRYGDKFHDTFGLQKNEAIVINGIGNYERFEVKEFDRINE